MNRKVAAVLLSLLITLLGATLLVNRTLATPHSVGGGGHTVYLPFITKPLPFDLAITDIEITQSIQTPTNNVPLVAQRHALVRVYAQTLYGTSPNNVVVTLEGIRNGSSLGILSANPRPISTNPSRANLSSTVNFLLPDGWRSGNVNLIATINTPDANTGNNVRQHVATFNSVPVLRVVIVPIHYTHTPTNQTYPAQSVDYISDWIQRSFPVHDVQVTMRTPHTFVGDLRSGNEWGRLLNQMYTLKLADGYPDDTPVFYYGFVPINNGSSQWFSSGIAGIGYVGFRESVGLNLGQNDNTGILAGHEFGHNMGQRHAPCGGPAGVDPNFPYVGGSIGEFGYDVAANAVRKPGNPDNPDDYWDMMSYCSPEWVSDYTYTALFWDQVNNGVMAAEEAVVSKQILVRADLNEDGNVDMRPIYQFEMNESNRPVSSATRHAVQLLDAAGSVIAQHPIALREAEEPGILVRSFNGILPLPVEPVASIRLVSLAGEAPAVLAEQVLTPRSLAARTNAGLTETADSIHLTWSDSNRPSIVRYTADDGATWTTLAIDHLGGELTVDREWLEGENGRFEIILANGANANVLTLER